MSKPYIGDHIRLYRVWAGKVVFTDAFVTEVFDNGILNLEIIEGGENGTCHKNECVKVTPLGEEHYDI